MLQIDVPNARLMDGFIDEPQSDLQGRDYYCYKTLGLPRLSKAYRDCKAGLRQEDKGLTRDEKKTVAGERKSGSYTPTDLSGGDDWVTSDHTDGEDFKTSEDWSGDPSAGAKDRGGDGTILGMEKSVGIPVVAISSIAILVGGILIVRKLIK